MQTAVESILRTVNRKEKNYNILTFPTHEAHQKNWESLPYTYYMWMGKDIKPWVNASRQLPKNHILLDGSDQQVKIDMKFDIVLSQNKFGQFQVAHQFAKAFGLPLISLEHTLPFPGWTQKQKDGMKNMRGDLNLFISEYSVQKWGFDPKDPTVGVIRHGIDTELFKPSPDIKKEDYSLNVANDAKNRTWAIGFNEWQQVVEDTNFKLVGDNPGLSKGTSSVEELVLEYQKARVFVSTTLVSPIPTVVLEAMSCGLPAIVLDNCMLPEVVQDGYNGYISNDIGYLKDRLKNLLDNPCKAAEMGENARKTILEKFSLEKHLNRWVEIFDSVYGKAVIR
jgi:glycosyltransferase involved in cell wall biosynthesis